MTESQRSFYITTAIDYPNALPHMGHAYEKIVADFFARASRLRGDETWFLIGLDEHGLKIQQAAEAAGESPQAFVDGRARIYRELYDLLRISFDDFVRTSEPRHHRFAQDFYRRAKERGDIYLGLYETDYCVACERALQKSEVAEGTCSTCGRPIDAPEITKIQEETYFFRLSAYRDRVREHIEENPRFIVPEWRRNEVLARLAEEVYDLSISRSTFRWGVPVPDDPEHVLYVWVDALSNYISALASPDAKLLRFWPADCHVIGKDILWFHTVIWPALLLSADYPLPRQVYVHGFILDKDGRKMSKSLGNVIDPVAVAREWGVDVLRFYFLRTFASGQDGNFALEELEERYRSELANDLGNLVMRLSKLGLSRAGGQIEPVSVADDLGIDAACDEYFARVDAREHHRAVEALWTLLRRTNAYLNDTAPWKVKDDVEVNRILYSALRAVDAALHLLLPMMPDTAARAAEFLGIELGSIERARGGGHAYAVRPAEALFPRRDDARKPGEAASSERKSATGTESATARSEPEPAGELDPFARLEIRIGRIEEVREHPDADALWAMIVDIGGERRSICAGLRAHVSAAELEGRKVAVLANLKPAKLRGIESRGMVLATDRRDGKVVPVDPGDAASGELVEVEGIAPEPKSKLSIRDFEKAPLAMAGGVVTYRGRELRTSSGPLRADAADGAPVR